MPEWLVETQHLDWASEATVDEDGVVRNVALSGNASQNGYAIPPHAYGSEDRVQSLYLNHSIFMDHLPREKLNNPLARKSEDLAGEIIAVRFRNGRPFGDIKTEGAPQGERFRGLVKGRFSGVGMSHVARYRFNKAQTEVESIEEVATVDVVVNPATTRNFSEQTHPNTEPDEVTPVMENQDKALALLNFASSGRFGALIHECMDSQNIGTAEMAEKLGCESATLADVIRGGRANPSGERINKLAEALGVSVEQVTEAIHPPAQEQGMEFKDLTAESLRKERPDLVDALLSKHTATEQSDAELKALKSQLESVQAEREAFAAKVEKFEAEQAIAKRRTAIQDELKAANLDPNDSVICSEQFMGSLLRVEGESERKALIEDRAKLFQHAQESVQHGSAPRHPEGTNDPKPESFITN